ncbi:hypothetical protein L6R29_02965 [Myxococcota bacterium]|nr:hypothetical protein [Myxococcota bacterium]
MTHPIQHFGKMQWNISHIDLLCFHDVALSASQRTPISEYSQQHCFYHERKLHPSLFCPHSNASCHPSSQSLNQIPRYQQTSSPPKRTQTLQRRRGLDT